MNNSTKDVVRSPEEVDVYVGRRIRMRRRLLGVSQQQLAGSLGLTFQQVQKYEKGANRVSASKLYEIAKALRTSVAYFFDGLVDPTTASKTEKTVNEFLMTPEGLELAGVFPKIKNGGVRRRILDLARDLAEDGVEGHDTNVVDFEPVRKAG